MSTLAPNYSAADLHMLQSEAAKRSNADPLPGPAGDAFAKNGPIMVGSFCVRQVVASDWKVMKAVDSPIIKMLQELRQNPSAPAEVNVTEDEEYMLALQFTRTPKEVRELMKNGKEHFLEVAREEIGDKIDEPILKLIECAVVEQVKRSWITAVSYREKLEEKGEVHFFQDTGTTSPETV